MSHFHRRSKRLRLAAPEPLESRRVLATFFVTESTDSGPGSLREAIDNSNHSPDIDEIFFLVDEVRLTTTELRITDPVSLGGFLSSFVRISAEDANSGLAGIGGGIRVFDIDVPSDADSPVVFQSLTITGGNVTGFGGAVRTNHDLVFNDVLIENNSASDDGGAVHARASANLEFNRVSITGNQTLQSGAGVYLFSIEPADFVLHDSTVSGNSARQAGGGVNLFTQGDVSIRNTVFEYNIGRFDSALGVSVGNFSPAGELAYGIVENVVVRNNQTVDLPGYASDSAAVTVTSSYNSIVEVRDITVSGNTSGRIGGAAFGAAYEGQITITGAVVTDNVALRQTGGVLLGGFGRSTVRMERSIISGNSSAFRGGGLGLNIYSEDYEGTYIEVVDSLVSGNTAGGSGGGVIIYGSQYSYDTEMLLQNTTVSGNSAGQYGGGIFAYNFNWSVELQHATIAENESGNSGGGVFVSDLSDVRLKSTLVADNTSAGISDDVYANGGLRGDYSLIETLFSVFPFTPDTNILGQDPDLLPLADNLGPTMTHALSPGSVAIDNGQLFLDSPQFDQRGAPFLRSAGQQVDIGALEVQMIQGDFNEDGQFDCIDIDELSWAVALASSDPVYDLNGEGVLDVDDIGEWLTTAGTLNVGGPYLFGDANLDGFVDASDFIVWNNNRFTNSAAWCDGSFNGDLFVDAQDFIIWNDNRFQSSTILLDEQRPKDRSRRLETAVAFDVTIPQTAPERVTWNPSEGATRSRSMRPLKTSLTGHEDFGLTPATDPIFRRV